MVGNVGEVDIYVYFLETENPKLEDVKELINKGAHDTFQGFWGACMRGHMESIHYLMSLGVNDWNGGLWGACEGEQIEVIKLMVSLGANKLLTGNKKFNLRIYRFCTKIIGNNYNVEKYQKRVQNEDPIYCLITHRFGPLSKIPIDLIRYLKDFLYY